MRCDAMQGCDERTMGRDESNLEEERKEKQITERQGILASVIEQEVPVDSDLCASLGTPAEAKQALARFLAARLRLAAWVLQLLYTFVFFRLSVDPVVTHHC